MMSDHVWPKSGLISHYVTPCKQNYNPHWLRELWYYIYIYTHICMYRYVCMYVYMYMCVYKMQAFTRLLWWLLQIDIFMYKVQRHKHRYSNGFSLPSLPLGGGRLDWKARRVSASDWPFSIAFKYKNASNTNIIILPSMLLMNEVLRVDHFLIIYMCVCMYIATYYYSEYTVKIEAKW